MSRNNNYQQIQEAASSIPSSTKEFLRTQQKDIVCNDCGGISATKVQQLLSTLEGTTQLFNTTPSSNRKKPNRSISKPKKKNSARNNSQKTSLRKNLKKKNPNKRIKQRKLNKNGIRSTLSSRNKNNNKIRLKSKNKKLSLKKK
ncbi:unnamed protein product [Adineta steineri]|uniref:Uncharacterized protein n=1 Tax=Adineta steineri TaxID=433720 RepID=A0A819LPP7_9BILA|nr:unnamed protein product [Adineta steineri]CAF3964386.1 unnamed protein product [Adineta steineri]CAF4086843.1 unnamed protein product [Adineta steineri]